MVKLVNCVRIFMKSKMFYYYYIIEYLIDGLLNRC